MKKIKTMPTLSVGKWALALSGVFTILGIISMYIYLPRALISSAYPISFACLILGITTLIKKDKAILLIIPILIGLLGMAWVLFQIIYPDWR